MGIMTQQIDRVAEPFQAEMVQIDFVLRALEEIGPHIRHIWETLAPVDQEMSSLVFRFWDYGVMNAGMKGFDVYGMLLVRTVDNFSIYLTELLTMVFEERPETLRHEASKMQLSALDVLNVEDTKRLIADKKIAQLDGGGVNAVVQFFRRLGVELELPEEDSLALNHAMALRNLVVHRRRRVDQTFLRETGRTDVEVDDQLRITMEDARRAWTAAGVVRQRISDAVGPHFGLNTKGPGGIRRGRPFANAATSGRTEQEGKVIDKGGA